MAGEREPDPVVLSWSSGKDSAFALLRLRSDPSVRVVALLTTVSDAYGRVSMHGVRETLLDRQAEATGLPIVKVRIPSPCPNAVYERAMGSALAGFRARGVRRVAFGDLYLADIRRYRESYLRAVGLEALFPLWGRPTDALAREMIAAGLRARLVCVDPRRLDRSFAGREFSPELLRDLPPGADPCGENGEFHTFVHAGPMFLRAIPVRSGPVVEREGFVFADLAPDEPPPRAVRPSGPSNPIVI